MSAPADNEPPATSRPLRPTRFPFSGHSETIVVAIYFFLWYSLTIGYNIASTSALYATPLPWSISAAQLALGSIVVLPLWVLKLRDAPRLTMTNIMHLSPIAMCHVLTHVWSIVGFRAGANSLVHIIKAAEPLFTALLSAVFLKQTFSCWVYLTLVPIIAGVGLASLKDLDFNWVAFTGAVGYTLAAATRAVLSKRLMGVDMGTNMSPATLHAVVTVMASAMFLPLSFIMEGHRIKDVLAATAYSPVSDDIIFNVVASGLFFHLSNEAAFRCLGRVLPLTHAVGSTFKRIFLIATSVVVFKSKPTALATMGSYVAVTGVLLYSLASQVIWKTQHHHGQGPQK